MTSFGALELASGVLTAGDSNSESEMSIGLVYRSSAFEVIGEFSLPHAPEFRFLALGGEDRSATVGWTKRISVTRMK